MGDRQRAADLSRLSRLSAENAPSLLRLDRWWRFGFLRGLLDRVEILRLDDPQTAYSIAKVAVDLAEKIPVDRPGHDCFRDRRQRAIWSTLAHAVLGSAAKSAGEPRKARLYLTLAQDQADEIVENPAWLQGEIALRQAALRYEAGDSAAGWQLVERALRKAAAEERELELGAQLKANALITRGIGRALNADDGALLDFAGAMQLANRSTRRGRTTFDAAVFNFMRALIDLGSDLPTQGRALEVIRELLRSMPYDRRLRRLRLLWAEGRVLANLGLRDQAYSQLAVIRDKLMRDNQSTLDVAVISLDLARITDDPTQLQFLSQTTTEYLAHHDHGSSALAAAIAILRKLPQPTRHLDEVQVRLIRTARQAAR